MPVPAALVGISWVESALEAGILEASRQDIIRQTRIFLIAPHLNPPVIIGCFTLTNFATLVHNIISRLS